MRGLGAEPLYNGRTGLEKGLIRMKNKLLAVIAAAAVLTSAGCAAKKDSKTDASTQSAQTQNNSVQDVSENYAAGASDNVDMDKIDGAGLDDANDENDSATLEESVVSIEDAKVVETDSGKIVIVSYDFTNKSDNEESFSSLIRSDAYQDGMSISRALINDAIDGFDPNSTAERIKPGKTITVQEAYVLVSDIAPVEIVAEEFHSQSGVRVLKTFNLQ